MQYKSTAGIEYSIICSSTRQNIKVLYSMESTDNVDIETGGADMESRSSTATSLPPKTTACKVILSKKSITKHTGGPSTSSPSTPGSSTTKANIPNAKKAKKRRDSGTSSEEERWLTAIESGKLEDVDDELRKMKNPNLMTARQRAMYERNVDKDGTELLMSLPIGYREKEKPQTAEDIQKAALKSQKRKQLADEKREKDKKKTMERLLKKQENKQRSAGRNKTPKTIQPMIRYTNNADGAFIHMPLEHDFPLQAQAVPAPPKPELCGIPGCTNRKVYKCSKTNVPLCSFACYRKNVQAVLQIVC